MEKWYLRPKGRKWPYCARVYSIRIFRDFGNDAVHPVNQKLKEGFTGQMAADDVEVGFCDEAEFGALDPITKRLPRKHTLREV
ncbi:proteasome subunit alpha type-2-like [Rhodnius prolixus]|uniref:proteasome subunit alpha type-2-like n=1 Tax=Rhodnius prolixus TaxID=13249 RepID=UPI003D188C2A